MSHPHAPDDAPTGSAAAPTRAGRPGRPGPAAARSGTAFTRAMRPVNALVERFIPSSLVFTIVLTFVVGLLCLLLTDAGPAAVVRGWGEGLAGLLAFITQMALVLMLGHVLANTGPVRRLLAALAAVPRTATAAYVFVFVVAAVANLITWGLGLVVGALLAKEVAAQGRERGLRLHFPLLVAAGFGGMVVWHMGYSGSGPLTAATPGSFLTESLGGAVVPVSATTFSWWNMTAAAVTIVAVAAALFLVAPRGTDPVVELEHDAREGRVPDPDVLTPADRLDASRVPTLALGVMLTAYLVMHFADGGTVTLDIVNWTFLALILLLVRLSAGILGMMTSSGLVAVLSEAFVAISSPQTFGLLAFLAAGLVNFFVPSGGGQFAVQGPIMLEAGQRLGVDPAVTIMAVSYGDQWTNMIQPFWAIPLLAIAGLKMRDILGYTTVVLVVSGVVFGATMLLVSL